MKSVDAGPPGTRDAPPGSPYDFPSVWSNWVTVEVRRVGLMRKDVAKFAARLTPSGGHVVTALAWFLTSSAGCGPSPEKKLTNPDPSGKIPAIKRAGRTHDLRAAPQLVKDLESDDPAVRFYAIEALKRLNQGDTLNYRFYDDADQREPAVASWREWLERLK